MHLCYLIIDVNVWLYPEAMKHMMDYVSMQCGYTLLYYCRTQMMIDIVTELTEK